MNIICAGFGGQGVLTAGLILGSKAASLGKNVTWIPSYGSEMRGGTANCNLKISDKKIGSPFINEIDVLIVMNQPSVDKFEEMVVPNGTVIVNKSLVRNHVFRKDLKVYEVDATNLADKLENHKGANLAMLGGLAKSNVLFDRKTLDEAINEYFEEKGRNNPKNQSCFDQGYEAAQKLQ